MLLWFRQCSIIYNNLLYFSYSSNCFFLFSSFPFCFFSYRPCFYSFFHWDQLSESGWLSSSSNFFIFYFFFFLHFFLTLLFNVFAFLSRFSSFILFLSPFSSPRELFFFFIFVFSFIFEYIIFYCKISENVKSSYLYLQLLESSWLFSYWFLQRSTFPNAVLFRYKILMLWSL